MTKYRCLGMLAWLSTIAGGCTAILAPDDDVQRCQSSSDCDSNFDNRVAYECRYGDPLASSEDHERICVATFKTVNCNGANAPSPPSGGPNVLAEQYAALTMTPFGGCDDTVPGLRGCPATAQGCAMGLVETAAGLCDVEADPEMPAVDLSQFADPGQDVNDAYCQSFFCNDTIVCDTTSYECVQCDPTKPPGEGGCAVVLRDEMPSCVYPDENDCRGPESIEYEPVFGDCSM